MNSLLILCLLQGLSSAQVQQNYYNILSLDGGGIRGLITAQVVEYMENYTYTYVRGKYCIDSRTIEKISMSDMFDMVSGTSTGSLLTTALVIPNDN
jgi:patatin-like phospholipase/acyl hydrolase